MPGDAPARSPQGAGRFHVLARGDGQHLPAHEAGEGGRVDHAEGDDDPGEPRPEHGAQRQGEHERGEREHRVHQTHHEPVGLSARVAGEEAEETARHHGDGHRPEPRHQRDARAPDHAREHVAPDVVGAEEMGAAGLGQDVAEVLLEGVVGRHDGREHRHHEGGEHHHHAEGGEAGAGGMPQHGPSPRAHGRRRHWSCHDRGRLSDIGSADRSSHTGDPRAGCSG